MVYEQYNLQKIKYHAVLQQVTKYLSKIAVFIWEQSNKYLLL